MSIKQVNVRNVVLLLMILAAAAMRLVSYKFPYLLSNFTPVGAIALFGGAYFTNKWKAYAVVLITLFTSDILINYLYTSKWVLWYGGSFWIYLTFAIMVLLGTFISHQRELLNKYVNSGLSLTLSVAIMSLAAILAHWLIIDLPWLYGTLYPHTLVGYGQSLVAAITFERNMVLGDVVFGFVLFGGFELAKSRYSLLRSRNEFAL